MHTKLGGFTQDQLLNTQIYSTVTGSARTDGDNRSAQESENYAGYLGTRVQL